MLGHYLLTFYRSLTRRRLYAALNVLGLAIGIAVFLALWLDVRFETGFERWIPHAEQLYVVRTSWIGTLTGLPPSNTSMGGLAEELRQDYPQLTATRSWNKSVTIRLNGESSPEQAEVVDPNFLQVFELPLVAGDRGAALASPDNVVLTADKARRYFGSTAVIGRPLTIVLQGVPHVYRVSGVLRSIPKATDLGFDFLVPLTPQMAAQESYWRHWGSEQLGTYLRFPRSTGAMALNADLDNFTDRHGVADVGAQAHKVMRLRLLPLVSSHLLDSKDRTVVVGLGAVGLLALLLAMVNYVNLATAQGGLRAREVAVRKVMGASTPALILQFLAESLATAALAALIGLALTEAALPLMNAMGGLALRVTYLGPDSVILVLLLIVAVVGLGAGAYPAIVLSGFNPAAVLASARTPGGGRVGSRVREGLVALQFAIAIAFMIATGVILAQTRMLRIADLGFQRHGLIVVSSFDSDEVSRKAQSTLLSAWRASPGVISAAGGDIAPGNEDNTNSNSVKRPGDAGNGVSLDFVQTTPDFFRTYGARLLAGRSLDPSHGGDDPAPPPKVAPYPTRNVVLNEEAVKVMGFPSPQRAIGQTLLSPGSMAIVGVVGNIRFRSPRAPVPPTIYRLTTRGFDNQVAGIRYSGDPRAVTRVLAARWGQVVPQTPFVAKTVEDNLQRYYRPDEQRARLFTMGAVLAVGIGCLGLYGLASFTTARRVKEIGIRKTLGASTRDVLVLLVGQFLRPVLLANLVAWPLAWLAMNNWLSGFDQRIGLSPLYFLAATLLSVAIAVGTVAGQALAVARAEPAKALRYE